MKKRKSAFRTLDVDRLLRTPPFRPTYNLPIKFVSYLALSVRSSRPWQVSLAHSARGALVPRPSGATVAAAPAAPSWRWLGAGPGRQLQRAWCRAAPHPATWGGAAPQTRMHAPVWGPPAPQTRMQPVAHAVVAALKKGAWRAPMRARRPASTAPLTAPCAASATTAAQPYPTRQEPPTTRRLAPMECRGGGRCEGRRGGGLTPGGA